MPLVCAFLAKSFCCISFSINGEGFSKWSSNFYLNSEYFLSPFSLINMDFDFAFILILLEFEKETPFSHNYFSVFWTFMKGLLISIFII